jgi:hypothetical protein
MTTMTAMVQTKIKINAVNSDGDVIILKYVIRSRWFLRKGIEFSNTVL